MSQCVECTVQIVGFRVEHTDAIIEAVKEHLDCKNVENHVYGRDMATTPSMDLTSTFSISGDVNDYAKAIIKSAWAANGEYCGIDVEMRLVEYSPVEEINGDMPLYDEFFHKPPEVKHAIEGHCPKCDECLTFIESEGDGELKERRWKCDDCGIKVTEIYCCVLIKQVIDGTGEVVLVEQSTRLIDGAPELLKAAKKVLEKLEHGDLAAAVSELQSAINCCEGREKANA